ncbi:MAG: hypothetical protein ACTSXC_06215 [Candidatus Freyarchaeota archaeon]
MRKIDLQGRTWRNIEAPIAEEIKLFLLKNGGEEQEVKNLSEGWRIKFSDVTFTYYEGGTLYSTPSSSKDPSVFNAWKHVDSLVGSSYVLPTRDFLIGLDETGKGEVIEHMILTGAIFPRGIFKDIDLLIGPADTKKRHGFRYWDGIFNKLDLFRREGLNFIFETVPPWQVDEYNINKIMDITYQRILNSFFRKAQINNCRIVMDDYGIGPTLQRFLLFLKNSGAEVIVTHNADDKYLEAKVASLIAKRIREYLIKKINENPEFRIDNLSVGSVNAGDPQTIRWLEKWHLSGKPWPWFVKQSFATIRKIDGKPKPVKKVPPIRESLLSEEFVKEFNEGRLSIQSLSIVCPSCGVMAKSTTFAVFEESGRKISELKCPNCSEFIRDSRFTLRFYCGYVIPDSSAVQRNLISNDLEASRFFEDFTVILVPIVRKECNGTSRGKTEFEKLRKYSTMGRIRLECPGKVGNMSSDLSTTARDEKIIDACVENNAILPTADGSMCTFAVGKNVFTIFI